MLTDLESSVESLSLTRDALAGQLAESGLDAETRATLESELAALRAAANKEVTPEVQAEVDRILGEKGLLGGTVDDGTTGDVADEPGEETSGDVADTPRGDRRRPRGG